MEHLNYKQLAFLLDIKPVEALEKIIGIHCRLKALPIPAPCEKVSEYLHTEDAKGKKRRNGYPEVMAITTLEAETGIPLQAAVTDIRENYLKRPATKKWILCDYPEKQLTLGKNKEKKPVLSLPTALHSMLPNEVLDQIEKEWISRYPNATIKL